MTGESGKPSMGTSKLLRFEPKEDEEAFKAMLSVSAALTDPKAIDEAVLTTNNQYYLYRDGLMCRDGSKLAAEKRFKTFFAAFEDVFIRTDVFSITIETLLRRLKMLGATSCNRGLGLFDLWLDVSSKNNRAYLYFGGKYDSAWVNALIYAEGLDATVLRKTQRLSGALGEALEHCFPYRRAPGEKGFHSA